MSEIKVGEYIRIKNGAIRKIIAINEGKEKTIFGKYRLDKDYNNCRSVAEKKIVNHSPNIIDLIECGDYVNGYKVIEKTKIENEGMQICIYKDNTCSCWRTINNITLKSIVTKEQFKESEYKNV